MTDRSAHLYNEYGQMYRTLNIDTFVLPETAETDMLINTYMSTLYEYHLDLAMAELVQKGYMEQKSGKVFDKEKTLRGIEGIKNELIRRLGISAFNQIHNSVDLSFIDKKPDLPNKNDKK